MVLWPGIALAGPPVLPPERSPEPVAASQPVPVVPVRVQEGGFAATPVQRPAGMPEQPRFAPVRPASPPAAQPVPVQPAAPSASVSPAPAVVVATPGPQPAAAPAPAPASPLATPPAQPSATPRTPVAADIDAEPLAASPDAALVDRTNPPRTRFQHRGFVADFRIGTLGCIGGLCRGAHDVSPGVRLGGFLGGNIRGWVELGVGGGWGTLTSKVAPGTNAMALYGLDPWGLQYLLLAQAAGLVNVDLAGLSVQDDQLRAAQLGPSLRVHLVPRGRIGAFVGTGVGYNVLRARYQTPLGEAGMGFHGIHVPVEANLSVYVLEHLAVGVQAEYMWTWYGLAVLDHPQQRIPMPMGVLQTAARTQGVDLRGQLPQFWTLGLAIRGRV